MWACAIVSHFTNMNAINVPWGNGGKMARVVEQIWSDVENMLLQQALKMWKMIVCTNYWKPSFRFPESASQQKNCSECTIRACWRYGNSKLFAKYAHWCWRPESNALGVWHTRSPARLTANCKKRITNSQTDMLVTGIAWPLETLSAHIP